MAHRGIISKVMKFLHFLFEWFNFYGRFVSVGSVLFRCFRYQLEQLYHCRNGVSYCICCWIWCWIKFVISRLVFSFSWWWWCCCSGCLVSGEQFRRTLYFRVEAQWIKLDINRIERFFFLSGFSFTHIHESLDRRGRGRAFL